MIEDKTTHEIKINEDIKLIINIPLSLSLDWFENNFKLLRAISNVSDKNLELKDELHLTKKKYNRKVFNKFDFYEDVNIFKEMIKTWFSDRKTVLAKYNITNLKEYDLFTKRIMYGFLKFKLNRKELYKELNIIPTNMNINELFEK